MSEREIAPGVWVLVAETDVPKEYRPYRWRDIFRTLITRRRTR